MPLRPPSTSVRATSRARATDHQFRTVATLAGRLRGASLLEGTEPRDEPS